MKLFVYGTLMQGFHNHGVLGNAKHIGNGYVAGKLYHLGGYPGLKPSDEDLVYGEFYEVEDAQWPRLDRLEGVPHLYTRETVTGYIYGVEEEYPLEGVQVYQYARDVPEHARIVTGRFEG